MSRSSVRNFSIALLAVAAVAAALTLRSTEAAGSEGVPGIGDGESPFDGGYGDVPHIPTGFKNTPSRPFRP